MKWQIYTNFMYLQIYSYNMVSETSKVIYINLRCTIFIILQHRRLHNWDWSDTFLVINITLRMSFVFLLRFEDIDFRSSVQDDDDESFLTCWRLVFKRTRTIFWLQSVCPHELRFPKIRRSSLYPVCLTKWKQSLVFFLLSDSFSRPSFVDFEFNCEFPVYTRSFAIIATSRHWVSIGFE